MDLPISEAVRLVMMVQRYRCINQNLIFFFAISGRGTTPGSAPTVTLISLCHGVQGTNEFDSFF